MNEKIKIKIEEFVKEIDYYELKLFDNGFFGMGILRKPEDHVKKGINTIVFKSYAVYDANMESETRLAMTEEEAECIKNGLGTVLEIFNRRKTENKKP